MKKKLIISISMFLIALLSFVTVAIAWFTPTSQSVQNIIVESGEMDVDAKLYQIEDFDRDGNPDKVNGEKVYTEVQQLIIEDMKPGDKYSCRLDVKNIGDATGNLNVNFEGINEDLKDVLSFASEVKDSSGDTITEYGTDGKKLFYDSVNLASINDIEDVEESSDYQYSIYFYIEFETLEELKILNPAVFDTKEDLNNYQNQTFSIAKINVNLSQAV